MANEDFGDSPLDKALKRQKELQDTIKTATDTIKVAMQELEKLKQFIDLYRSFSTDIESVVKGGSDSPQALAPASAKLKGHAHGQTQAVFEALALDILRDVGRPIKSPEFIEEFRKRGQPLGGNEVRTAWNRLWQARKAGLLTHDVKLGYWIAGEPLSDEARVRALEAGKRKPRRGPSMQALTKGKPKGPPRALTPEQVQTIERLLLSGKTRKEVCELFGISMGTLAAYVGRDAAFRARYPDVVIPKPPYRQRPFRPGYKPGRPRLLNDEQVRQIGELRAQGNTIRKIAETMNLKPSLVHKTVQRLDAEKDSDLDLSRELGPGN